MSTSISGLTIVSSAESGVLSTSLSGISISASTSPAGHVSISATNSNSVSSNSDVHSGTLVHNNPMGGPINSTIERCTSYIVPLVDDEARIRAIKNAGLSGLKLAVIDFRNSLDKSFSKALLGLIAMRRIDEFLSSKNTNPTPAEVKALRDFLQTMVDELVQVEAEFQSLHIRLDTLLSEAKNFESKCAKEVPKDEASSNPNITTTIVQYLEVDMERSYALEQAPDLCKKIKGCIMDDSIFRADVYDLAEWWSRIAGAVDNLRTITTDEELISSLKERFLEFHEYFVPYISQMQKTVKEHKAFTKAERSIDSAKLNVWKPPNGAIPLSPPQWTNDPKTNSFTFFSKPVTVNIEGQDLLHHVTARIVHIAKFPNSCYGVKLRIVARNQSPVAEDEAMEEGQALEATQADKAQQDSGKAKVRNRKYRCTRITAKWSFEQEADATTNPSIVDFAPTMSTSNTTEEKGTSKWTIKSPTKIGPARLPEISKEAGKEMSIPYSAQVSGINLDSNCTWEITEQPKLKRGVVDCDLGVVLALNPRCAAITSLQLKLSLHYKCTWKGKLRLNENNLPSSTYRSERDAKASGSTAIPFQIYSELGLIPKEESQATFLEGCGLLPGQKL